MGKKSVNDNNNEEKRHARPQNSRPTIGLLTGRISDELGTTFLTGVADAAEERDANLITFIGESLRSPHGFEAQGNVLYDLVTAGVVDGLVVDSGLLGHYVGPEAMQDFCGRFRDIPVVSVEVPLEGIPSVLADFYQGMRNVITHLIEVHGYRRIAFIRGPEESLTGEERYRAYQDALAEHDIPLDMDLVAPGTFFEPSGEEAVRLLMDKRKAAFEAVAAANDFMAVDAMQALQARGIRVPGDVAVTGFDNFGVASVVTPPLTTARLGNYERAHQAAEMLLAQLEGKEVSERVVRPAELVVRQSCGCPSLAVVEAAAGPVMATGESIEVALAMQREQILSEMVQGVGPSAVQVGRWAEQLLDALSAELGGESTGAFLSALAEVLTQAAAAGGDPSTGSSAGSPHGSGQSVAWWQGALSVLRRHAVPSLGSHEALSQAEDLWQQARVMIGETAERTQAYRRLQSERRAQVLREVGEVLITTHDVAELMDILVEELPRLDVRSCYLSLYEDPRSPAEWSRLVLAYREGERVVLEEGGRRFASRQLVTEGLLPEDRRYQLVVEPLYFREGQIGFALFEFAEVAGQGGLISEALRGQISSALRGALLLEERKRAEEKIEHLNLVLSAIRNVNQLITRERDSGRLLQGACETLIATRGYHSAWIALLDESEGLVTSAEAGLGEDFLPLVERLERGELTDCVQRALKQSGVVVTEDPPSTCANCPLSNTYGGRGAVTIRLEYGGKVYGLLSVSIPRDLTADEEEQALFKEVAGDIAFALHSGEQEEALAWERYLLKTLMDNVPDAIYFKDTDSRFIRTNQAHAKRWFGLSDPAQAVGKTDFDFFSEEHARQAYEDEQEIIRTGQPLLNMEERETWPDRPDTWVVTSKMPLRDEEGKIIGTFGLTRDITDRKRAEEALKEYSERLEEMVEERTQELRDAQEQLVRREKLAVLGQMAGGVGHELRNPLGAISNAAYFLNMVLEEPEPEVKETLEILEKEVKTSETIISSLLDFARAKPPTRRKVDINEVVQEALSRIAVPENVEVVGQLDETLPIMLADPDQLGQVFGNIILNGIQAMPEGGQLVVRTSASPSTPLRTGSVEPSEAPSTEWVAVSIADTGVGIPEENLSKLFEPLFTTKAKGIGLGLALTKTLVEGHGGTIEVESQVGKGTTFRVRLPMSGG
jgi:PAS domain S-box-containing protein